MSRAEPLGFYARAGRYLGTEIDYFTWQESPRLRRRLTGPQWRRLQHKGRSPRGNRVYYQHAPNKGVPTPRRNVARAEARRASPFAEPGRQGQQRCRLCGLWVQAVPGGTVADGMTAHRRTVHGA